MAKMHLLTGEQTVLSANDDVMVLTNWRVRSDVVVTGQSSLVSITLGSVASCALRTKSYPMLLFLAGVAVLGALAMNDDSSVVLGLAAAVCGIAYVLTRQSALVIASNGGDAITMPVRGMARTTVIEFIDALEQAKLEYLRNA